MSDENEEATKVSVADARRKLSPKEAREAAAEAGGFLASIILTVGTDEDFEVPQRGLLDDEQRERMDQLEFDSQSWDREPDVEITRPDGTTYTLRGNLKLPYQKGGQLVKPPYAQQVAIALWGEAKWKRYKKGGGSAVDVTATLQRLDRVMEERVRRDPKSVGGAD